MSGCSLVLVDEPCDTDTATVDETGAPPELLFLAAATGATHTCGILDDATLLCWGLGDEGQLDAPDGPFDMLSAGHAHTCAIDASGETFCWGRNDHGQTELSGDFVSVSAGGAHSCGLDAAGSVTCVGRNDVGQADVPAHAFLSISAGEKHTCGIVSLEDGNTGSVCWGELKKEAVFGEAHTRVISGSNWACTDAPSGMDCFDGSGERDLDVPDGVVSGSTILGGHHGCGLTSDESILCWGEGESGQKDAPGGAYAKLFSGPTSLHTCALHSGEEEAAPLTCWGLDAENQLTP